MTETITITKIDEVYNKISCDPGIKQEMVDYFTFKVPGYQFMPTYRNKMWDGNIRLLNYMSGQLYGGLMHHVQQFARERDYQIRYGFSQAAENISLHEAEQFFRKLVKEGKINIDPRDYQLEALVDAVRYKRLLFHSAVNSGKSFIMYMIMRWFLERTLIIVPRTQLVHQLYTDFEDYGFNSEKYAHKLPGDKDDRNKPVVITTWQTARTMPPKWFEKFKMVIGDEAHNFKANELKGIMEKMTAAEYRFGFSGSLEETKTHMLVLEGLFGPKKDVIRSKEMIERGYSAKTNIKIIVLDHSKDNRKILADKVRKLKGTEKYKVEKDQIIGYAPRNNFMKNLALSLKGNTLLLVEHVDHGSELVSLLSGQAKGPVFYIHGDVSVEKREEIRKHLDQIKNGFLVATFGAFQEGSNIKRIHNLILASPSKSYVRIVQSIGRGQRMDDEGSELNLFDIADDLSHNDRPNGTYIHLMERIEIYNKEGFDYKTYTVKLK